jgi:hypothetical protein
VFALANVLDLLVNERASGGRWCLALSLRLARAKCGLSFRHVEILLVACVSSKSRTSLVSGELTARAARLCAFVSFRRASNV